MCGRYTVTGSHEEIVARFDVRAWDQEVRSRFNVAPSQMVPIVFVDDLGKIKMQHCRWGFQPRWAAEKAKVSGTNAFRPLINARFETINENLFRDAFKKRRCLIPADGFFEWKDKNPMYIRMRNRGIFAFAGIFEDCHPEDRTFAVITVPANSFMSEIHGRMPAILRPENEKIWLSVEKSPEIALSLLAPCEDSLLEAYPVSRLVNSPKNDISACLTRAEFPIPGSDEQSNEKQRKSAVRNRKQGNNDMPRQTNIFEDL